MKFFGTYTNLDVINGCFYSHNNKYYLPIENNIVQFLEGEDIFIYCETFIE